MRRAKALLGVCLAVATLSSPARAEAGRTMLILPVDGVVERAFDAPRTSFSAGHRGIDLGADPGTAVRAAGQGIVTFAGRVGDSVAVTIAHSGGLESTYSVLSEVLVAPGDRVSAGTWIGRVGTAHPGSDPGLHFGVKLEGAYVDPEAFIGPLDTGSAIHLAPLTWRPPAAMGESFASAFEVQDYARSCRSPEELAPAERPPNDNLAVAVAGIGSSTAGARVNAAMYEHGPEELGYPGDRIYRFSYKGPRGSRLHEPYRTVDTFGDIRKAAEKLRDLLRAIARRHPGRSVDLIAHSQGGIVARTYLSLVAAEWDPGLPRVEHLVTFSSPHDGAPVADLADALPQRTLTGRSLVRAASRWARAGGPLPDPLSTAVGQLKPGSPLLRELDGEDLLFGTRALALTIPNDVVVPAGRAGLPEEITRAVPPAGLNGHSAITASARARALAYSFLRDAADPCRTAWDAWAPRAGAVIEKAQDKVPDLLARLERAAIRRLVMLVVP